MGKRVINIPKEVLKRAQLTSTASIDELKTSPEVRAWLRQELLQCQKELPILEAKLAVANERLTTRLCMELVNPLYKLSRQFLVDGRNIKL